MVKESISEACLSCGQPLPASDVGRYTICLRCEGARSLAAQAGHCICNRGDRKPAFKDNGFHVTVVCARCLGEIPKEDIRA